MEKIGNGETAVLAQYAADLRYEDLPAEVVHRAKTILLDTLGVLIGASARKVGIQVANVVLELGGKPEVSLIGRSGKVDLFNGALANGTLGHDMELDDIHHPSCTHAAAVLVPALLAMAERCGSSGRDVITALVLAYEVECRISCALGSPEQYARAFHPTCVCGAFGAAAGCGKLLGLTKAEHEFCLGLAGSQASGLTAWENDPEHSMKSFQTGVGARNGVTAALLAKAGVSAAPNVLDGRFNVFDAFSGNYNFEALTAGLGESFEIMRTSLKRYPCCRYIHSALDAFRQMRREHPIQPEDIVHMDVHICDTGAPIIDRNELYTHNCQFVLACDLIYGDITHDIYLVDKRSNPAIIELSERITLHASQELEAIYPEAWGSIVEVELATGERLNYRVDYPKGSPENPLNDEEIIAKFMSISPGVLGAGISEQLCGMCLELENVTAIQKICDLLRTM